MLKRYESNRTTSFDGYHVEVRSTDPRPRQIGDFILTDSWQKIPVGITPHPGIPNRLNNREHAYGLLTYEAAHAIAASFAGQQFLMGVEFRLVKIKVAVTHIHTNLGYGEPFAFSELHKTWTPEPAEKGAGE